MKKRAPLGTGPPELANWQRCPAIEKPGQRFIPRLDTLVEIDRIVRPSPGGNGRRRVACAKRFVRVSRGAVASV